VQDRLAGTLACVARARRSGAHIVRVHDVNATVQLLQMLAAIELP
jgi:dihydropteroate synthase